MVIPPDRIPPGHVPTGHYDGFNLPVNGGSPRYGSLRWGRVGLLGVSFLITFVLGLVALNVVVLLNGANNIDRVSIQGGLEAAAPAAQGEPQEAQLEPTLAGRTTVLLVGSDSRAGLSDDQLAAIGTTDHGSDLTDTIILLQLDADTGSAQLLSFPRDLWVEGCTGANSRINAVFADGEQVNGQGMGPSCLVNTVEDLTGIGIDHYMRIDFSGFVQAVDAVGGVTFYVDQPLKDRFAGLDIPAGCVDFDGVKAIQFVRARHLDSDLGRIARQQRFAAEMLRQITSVQTLANPLRLNELVGSIAGSLQTDDQLGTSTMVALARALTSLNADGLQAQTVPVTAATIGGAAVLRPLEAEAQAVYATFRGEPTQQQVAAVAASDSEPTASETSVEESPGPSAPVAEPTPTASPTEFAGAETNGNSC